MLFDKSVGSQPDIYNKLLSDKLDADLVYLYENVAAQMLTAAKGNCIIILGKRKTVHISMKLIF